MDSIRLTIRIPRPLEEILKARALSAGRTVQAEIIHLLERALSTAVSTPKPAAKQSPDSMTAGGLEPASESLLSSPPVDGC